MGRGRDRARRAALRARERCDRRALRREPVPQPRGQPDHLGRGRARRGAGRTQHHRVPQHRRARDRRRRHRRRARRDRRARLDHGLGDAHDLHEPLLPGLHGRRPRRSPRRRRVPHRTRGIARVRRVVGARGGRRRAARLDDPLLHEGPRPPGRLRRARLREGHHPDPDPDVAHPAVGRQGRALLVDRVGRPPRHRARQRDHPRRAPAGSTPRTSISSGWAPSPASASTGASSGTTC